MSVDRHVRARNHVLVERVLEDEVPVEVERILLSVRQARDGGGHIVLVAERLRREVARVANLRRRQAAPRDGGGRAAS
eukprot:4729102-Prymnesium_polylepis.1